MDILQDSILIIDDEPGNRASLRFALEQADCLVAEAADDAEALSILTARAFDIVLLDLCMPHAGGFAILDHLRRIRSTSTVVLINAAAVIADLRETMHIEAHDFVPKPFCAEEVVARTQRALRSREDAHVCARA